MGSSSLKNFQNFPEEGFDYDNLTVSNTVTVELEGRSICPRINLEKHRSYQSLANTLRQMFVYGDDHDSQQIELSNAVPGHLIAYEDIENDLLLAGDLEWIDFVRVAKRIRILPVNTNSMKAMVADLKNKEKGKQLMVEKK